MYHGSHHIPQSQSCQVTAAVAFDPFLNKTGPVHHVFAKRCSQCEPTMTPKWFQTRSKLLFLRSIDDFQITIFLSLPCSLHQDNSFITCSLTQWRQHHLIRPDAPGATPSPNLLQRGSHRMKIIPDDGTFLIPWVLAKARIKRVHPLPPSHRRCRFLRGKTQLCHDPDKPPRIKHEHRLPQQIWTKDSTHDHRCR